MPPMAVLAKTLFAAIFMFAFMLNVAYFGCYQWFVARWEVYILLLACTLGEATVSVPPK